MDHLPTPSPAVSEGTWCSAGESSLSSSSQFLFVYKMHLWSMKKTENRGETQLLNLKKCKWIKPICYEHAVTSLNQLMVWNSRVQRNSFSAFDRLSIFSTTSMSVRITGQPVITQKQNWFYSHRNENKLVSEGKCITSTSSPSRPSISSRPPSFCFSSQSLRRRKNGDRQRGDTRLSPQNIPGETHPTFLLIICMFVRHYTIQLNCDYYLWGDWPVCLLGLTLLLSFVLDVFGQYRQQVDGNVFLTLLLIQVVHHTGWKRKGTETQN